MSIKRIIELEEVKVNGKKYYKAVGCNTLFFDKNGFDKITKPLEEEKPQRLNCKFVVTNLNGCESMTKGKIYEVVDGFFVDDENFKYPIDKPLDTFHSLILYMHCRYSLRPMDVLEVVE